MAAKRRALIAGESWTVHSTHQKGFDSFSTVEYSEGIHWLRQALESGGWAVDYQPAHVAARDFPFDAKALSQYGCVMLSDVGANTLLLHPDTFTRSVARPNRLHAIRDYVAAGGGFVMIGGYLTFQGIDAKAQYSGTAIEEILPVQISRYDDRAECPQGVAPLVVKPDHPILDGITSDWPHLLGFNRVTAKEERRHRQDRRRPAAGRRRLWSGSNGSLHLRLCAPLGAARLRRMARLCATVAADRVLGRGSTVGRVPGTPRSEQRQVDAVGHGRYTGGARMNVITGIEGG